MSQILRALPLAIAILPFLVSCGGSTKDAPPPAGTVVAADPAAANLLAAAQAADTAGNTKKALKLYTEVAEKHPYSEVAPQARFRQAALLDHQGEPMDAFEAYQAFITRYRGSSLYTQALERQAAVAHAAADGHIKTNFLGLKSKISSKESTEMLTMVRDNAPQAPTAPKAQFTIGQVWEGHKKVPEAIAAYTKTATDYPLTSYAPEAHFRIGTILLDESSDGNQNPANLDRARRAFEDLLQTYPNAKRAPEAREKLRSIGAADIQRSYDIGEFYYKKKQPTSAIFYYKEVLRTAKSGPLHDKAAARLAELQAAN
ncbi:MAG: tetratricopeptide repeat protein [Verrucomicrobia bacterium]|nr:tetratricopeptide repeat protein [Verrucomicrobiota bacterium]MDA1005005.1 tetratricopeptide repeat protein [Verrucomicrobiota bacterium]